MALARPWAVGPAVTRGAPTAATAWAAASARSCPAAAAADQAPNSLRVNLFVVAVGGGDPAPALRALVKRLPFFPDRRGLATHTRPFAAAWVQHEPGDGLFAGHPRGRFVRVHWDGELHVESDELGAYPVYETWVGDTRYVSNNAEVLRAIRGTREVSLDSVAGLLGGGWPLAGDPMGDGVRRLNTPAPRATDTDEVAAGR